MNNKEIQKSLRRVVNEAPINLLGRIQASPILKIDQHDRITRQDPPTKPFKRIPCLAAAAAVITLLISGWHYQYQIPDTEIFLDINPSIKIVTNRADHVLKFSGENPDGERLIDHLNLEGQPLQEAIPLLMERMLQLGYLKDSQEVLLLSVHNDDPKKEAEKLSQTDNFIHQTLQEEGYHVIVLGQKMEKSPELLEEAARYNISPGKMTLIHRLIQLDHGLTARDLTQRSLKELLQISLSSDSALPSDSKDQKDPDKDRDRDNNHDTDSDDDEDGMHQEDGNAACSGEVQSGAGEDGDSEEEDEEKDEGDTRDDMEDASDDTEDAFNDEDDGDDSIKEI